MKHIDSNIFWKSGFVVQVNEDQIFVAQGPFEGVTLQRQTFKEQVGLNDLLIKPNYWDFLSDQSEVTHAFRPQVSAWFTRKEFQDFTLSAQKTNLPDFKWSQAFKADFTTQFLEMQKLINSGLLEKAVPVGRSEAQFSSDVLPQMLIKNLLSDTTASGWIYGFWDQEQGFIGRTPELLFQSYPIENKTITTMALAGTWPKNAEQINDYNDPKIWNEHQIVVKDIKNQLSGLECVRHSVTEVIELKNLAHLKTHLEFQYNSVEQILDVIRDLHPTAALGIYPRRSNISKKIQLMPLQSERKNFGAPFGLVGKNLSHLVVGIRSVQWNRNQMHLYAGCGITKDSQLESEYQEILYKMDAVKKMLGLTS